MKNSKTHVYKRQQEILQQLYDQKQVSTDHLAEELHVSALTIRRDLHDFAQRGLVRLIRGGANLITGALQDDPTTSETAILHQSSKEAIAQRAAELVADGDTILINSSSTAILILKYIKGKRITAVTNNGKAAAMQIDPLIELIFTGGEVHANKQSMVGEIAISNLSRITADKLFLGVSGISARGGISTSVLQETAINDLMIRRSNQCYVLADGSKVGEQSNFVLGPANQARMLITDQAADPGSVFQLRDLGIQVEQVE